MRRTRSWGSALASILPGGLLSSGRQANGGGAAQLPGLALAVMAGGLLFALYIYAAAPCLAGSGCSGGGKPFAKLWAAEEAPHIAEQCAAALRIPQIALLFLSRGDMPHERVWAAWLSGVQGLLPMARARPAICKDKAYDIIKDACEGLAEATGSALHRQVLFNVYNHPAPTFPGFPRGSLFRGHELAHRVATSWGDANLVTAEKLLMRAALLEPRNAWFVLLSESDVPLYPATVVYQELTATSKSRINACSEEAGGIGRKTETYMLHKNLTRNSNITRSSWRKSKQWVGLLRKHAQLVVSDTFYFQTFEKYCLKGHIENKIWKQCYPDEHYIPTLLAMHDKDAETDCWGNLMMYNWSIPATTHPVTYIPERLQPSQFHWLRAQINQGREMAKPVELTCDAEYAMWLAPQRYLHADELQEMLCGTLLRNWAPDMLGPACGLFARKFSANTTQLLLSMFSDCKHGLEIIPPAGDECPPPPKPPALFRKDKELSRKIARKQERQAERRDAVFR